MCDDCVISLMRSPPILLDSPCFDKTEAESEQGIPSKLLLFSLFLSPNLNIITSSLKLGLKLSLQCKTRWTQANKTTLAQVVN